MRICTTPASCFPHVYAAIPVSAAVAVHPLPRAATGDRFEF